MVNLTIHFILEHAAEVNPEVQTVYTVFARVTVQVTKACGTRISNS